MIETLFVPNRIPQNSLQIKIIQDNTFADQKDREVNDPLYYLFISTN